MGLCEQCNEPVHETKDLRNKLAYEIVGHLFL